MRDAMRSRHRHTSQVVRPLTGSHEIAKPCARQINTAVRPSPHLPYRGIVTTYYCFQATLAADAAKCNAAPMDSFGRNGSAHKPFQLILRPRDNLFDRLTLPQSSQHLV